MSDPSQLMPRRRFLAAGVSAPGLAPMAFLRARNGSPNDEIPMGVIGCGGQGSGNMASFLNIRGVRVVVVRDMDARAKHPRLGALSLPEQNHIHHN